MKSLALPCPVGLCVDWIRRLMLTETSGKSYLVFQSKQAYQTCYGHYMFCSLDTVWLCPCGSNGVAVLYCTCLLHYWGETTLLLWFCGNLTPACLQVLAEGHRSIAQCSIQGQSSKILNATMCWQRGILTKGTMARVELCILIYLFLGLVKCWNVLVLCAVFMVKTWLCNTWTESFSLISSNTVMKMVKHVYTVAPSLSN